MYVTGFLFSLVGVESTKESFKAVIFFTVIFELYSEFEGLMLETPML